MPDYDTGEEECHYQAETETLKLVSNYTGLNFNEVVELDCITFKLLIKDALIYKLNQSDEGKEYLENCWILQQNEPDRKELRKRM